MIGNTVQIDFTASSVEQPGFALPSAGHDLAYSVARYARTSFKRDREVCRQCESRPPGPEASQQDSHLTAVNYVVRVGVL